MRIKDNISYHDFRLNGSADIAKVDELIAIIVDVIMTRGETVRVNSEDKPRELVINRLLQLSYEHIEFVLSRLDRVNGSVTKKKPYMLTMLYNSTLEIETHSVVG